MRFNSLALGLTLASAALLSACGGGGGSGDNTDVRLLNASVGYANLDLSVNSTKVNSSVAYGSVGSYGSVSTGSTASLLLDSSNGSTLLSWTPTLAGNSKSTIIAYGAAGSVKQTLLQEVEAAANANQSKLLVLNRASDAGSLDLYLTAEKNTDPMSRYSATASNIQSATNYLPLTSGKFRLTLTGNGLPDDVRLDIPSVTLDSTKVYTLVAVTATTAVNTSSTTGGRLVDAILLEQQGAATSYKATTARARLINGLASVAAHNADGSASSEGTSVTASINNQSLLSSSLAPAIGKYVTTTAGGYKLDLSINGTQVSYTMPATTTLAAGGDFSFLVSGTPAAPVVSLIADDNRLPISGYTKVRLVNGVASSTAAAGMLVDLAEVARNVLPGTSSAPFSLITNSNLGSRVMINLSTANPALTEKVGQPFYANGVYSAFVLGNPVLPYPIVLRREDTSQ